MKEIKFPVIEIGKRYRIKNRPTEVVCPACGRDECLPEHIGDIIIVEVFNLSSGDLSCPDCGRSFVVPADGRYNCLWDNRMISVPFTSFLEAIE